MSTTVEGTRVATLPPVQVATPGLVTPEAVVLQFETAGIGSRFLAAMIDLFIQGVVLVVASIALVVFAGSGDGGGDVAATVLLLLIVTAVLLGYPVAFETLSRGRSLGKLALGLRVVREDGGPIRFRHAFVRGLLGVVEFWLTFGSVALITSLASARGKRLGDFLAGTVVIRERVPTQGAPVTPMPPQLAGWAGGLDLARIPDDLALAARQYLSRFHDLAPAVRDEMGARLAGAMAAVTSPPPPPGVPAWAFLSAVLAERRRRELARLQPPTDAPWAPAPPAPYGGTPSAGAAPAADEGNPFAPPS